MQKPPAGKKVSRVAPKDGANHIQVEQRPEFFSGPLPPPATLRQFDEIAPAFAERLLRLTETETEAEHRRSIVTRAQRQDAIETAVGQVFALIIALAAFRTTAWLGFLGHAGAASIVGGTTIVALFGAFIAGRHQPPE